MLHAAGAFASEVHDAQIESHVPGKKARAVRQPVGVVVGIAPWNAPVILGTRAIASPLALGNTVVLKASEECPRTHAAIVTAARGGRVCPAGVVNLIVNAPADAADVVDELIAHPAVRRVNFTGSTRVGPHRRRERRAAPQARAARARRQGADGGAGRTPTSSARSRPRTSARSSTRARSACRPSASWSTARWRTTSRRSSGERAAALKVGDPADPETQIGPLVNEAAVKRVSELVDDAVSKGAEVISGGSADGPFFEPTVLKGVTPEMRIYAEESFGPVVSIVPVDGVDEAVRVANDTEYGLSSAVFSEDVDAALEVAARLETGMCHVNDTTVHDEPQMPFGGVKDSRLGPLRRRRGGGGVHRAALDHGPGGAARVPDLADQPSADVSICSSARRAGGRPGA